MRIEFGYPSGMGRIARWMLAATLGTVGAAAMVTPAHAATPTVDCVYTFNTWPGGYFAEITITNNGPAIDGWTAYWELPSPAVLNVTWDADITQTSPTEMTATNLGYNEVIPTGAHVDFGWTAAAPDTGAPVELTLNGVDC